MVGFPSSCGDPARARRGVSGATTHRRSDPPNGAPRADAHLRTVVVPAGAVVAELELVPLFDV